MGTKLKCKKCGSIIESKYRHDFVWCSCESIFIDGGRDYTKFGGDENLILVERNNDFVPLLEILDVEEKEKINNNLGDGI